MGLGSGYASTKVIEGDAHFEILGVPRVATGMYWVEGLGRTWDGVSHQSWGVARSLAGAGIEDLAAPV